MADNLGHIGSWGLPDYGITEAIGNLLGTGKTAQGGSNIVPQNVQSGISSAVRAVSPITLPVGGTSVDSQKGVQGWNNLPGASTSQTYGPANNTLSGGGGGDSRLAQLSKTSRNPAQEAEYQALMDAAKGSNGALLSQLNTQYDQTAANLQNQLGYLGQQKDSSLTDLQNALQAVVDQVNKSKTDSQQNFQTQTDDALQTANDTQLQNRNVLRALGIINSSAAGDLLTKPMNQYDKTRATLLQQHTSRLDDLNNVLQQKTSENANAVKSLESQYANLVGNIQSDLRFNDRQRADAIQGANAALQQRLADIQSAQAAFEQSVQAQKQQSLSAIGGIQGYSNPTADLSGILGQMLNSGQSTNPTTVGIAQTSPANDQKKKSGGFLSDLLSSF